MAPPEYFVRLQQGITGGFAPPTPSALHTLTRSAEQPQTLLVQSMHRPDGTPDLVPASAAPKQLDAGNHESLIDELYGILKSIPTEYPPGSQDIYGLDTGIAFGSNDLEWSNGGPQGCGQGVSERQPTEEDKEKFKRAVDIVKTLAAA